MNNVSGTKMSLAPDSDLWLYFTNFKEEGVAECNLCTQRLKNNRSYNLKLHLNKVHLNRSEIDKYFHVNAFANIATCRTCNHPIQNRLCNIRMHMRKLHNIEIKLPEDNKPVRNAPSPQPYDEDQIEAVIQVAKRKMAEQEASSEKRPTRRLLIKIDKNTILRSVIGLIVEDGISPQLFSSQYFDAILRPMCESISVKQHKEFKLNDDEIETILNAMAYYIRNNFSNDLNCRLLVIKINNDLGALNSVFCVSAVFVNDDEVQNHTLGLIELDDNTQLQEDHIKQILHKFNIDTNQIIDVLWDNTKSQCEKHVPNSEYLMEIEKFAAYPELYLGDVKIEPYFASKAQLCLLNIFKNSQIFQHFSECRSLVKFLNDKTNGYFEIFESHKATLPRPDSPWNAGSTCKMMNYLLEARHFLEEVKFEKPPEAIDQFNCNEAFWSFVEAFCKSTNYLQKAILKYRNDDLGVGDFYAQWLKCKLLTEKFSAENKNSNEFFSIILSELLKNIESITNNLLQNEHIAACLYLDPRFQRILNNAQKTIAVEYLKKLWFRFKLYSHDDNIVVKNEPAELCEENEDAFLNEFLSHVPYVKDGISSDVSRKIEGLMLAFQTADTNIQAFWKGLQRSDPELYILSTICFTIPATEIYTEIRYSHWYRVNVDLEMSPFTKENLFFLRLNMHLLDDALAHAQLIGDEQSNYMLNFSDNGTSDSNEESDDENSNAASTSTAVTGGSSKSSNTDMKTSFIEVEVEEFI